MDKPIAHENPQHKQIGPKKSPALRRDFLMNMSI